MEEMKMFPSGKEGVDETDETNYVWGEEKPKGNYKSVNIRGEVYDVGQCVQCNLESKESFIWKILKLFQVGDRKMCRIRRLFSESELPRNVKELDPPAEPKELFLASNGPDVQEDVSLGKVARRYIIFCTFQDDEMLNPTPSSEQIEKADYFFHRGYDPANEEVIALDGVVDELGAQYVYNKSWWLGDNVARRSSSQISASRIDSQSPASGSSAHQVVAKAPAKIISVRGRGVSSVSAKPPFSTSKPIQREGKGQVLKTSSSPTPLVGSKQAEAKGGMSADRKRKDGEMPSEGTVKRIVKPGERSNAPSGRENPLNLQRRADEVIGMATSRGSKQAVTKDGGGSVERQRKNVEKPSEGAVKKIFKLAERPSASSGNPAKLQRRADGEIVMTTSHAARKVPSAPTSFPKMVKNLTVEIPTVNPSEMKTGRSVPSASPRAPKEVVKTDVGGRVLKSDEDVADAPSISQRQSGSPSLNIPARNGTGSTPKDPSRPKLSPLESPRPTLSKSLSDRDIDVMNFSALSPAASPRQKPHGPIFKPKVEDWDATIAQAVQSNRILLLKNVDPELHSEDLAEALTEHMRTKCEVRIVPPLSFSYRTTTALLKLPSFKKAQEFLKEMESKHLVVANRIVTATSFSHDDFKGPQVLKYPGHLEFSQVRDHHVEDYKNAVATSHLAQGNTIEFAYGLPWRVLDEQHEDQWRMLQEAHSTMNTKAGPH